MSGVIPSSRVRDSKRGATAHAPQPQPNFTRNAGAEQGDAATSKAASFKYEGRNEERRAGQVISHIASVRSGRIVWAAIRPHVK